jgi:hypothetical protein
MKKQYDFSKGERGKFYRKDVNLNIPVYLEPEALKFVGDIASKRNVDLTTIVNDLIKNNMKLAEVFK